MAPRKSTVEHTQIAARAAIEKLGTDLVAIDLSEQMLLSEVFLLISGQNERRSMRSLMKLKSNSPLKVKSLCDARVQSIGFSLIMKISWCMFRRKKYEVITCSIAFGMTVRISH